MSTPTVTILLPARDAGATLAQAVDSMLGQTFTDFELLAVEDGSTDGTAALLAQYARADARVRVLATGGVGLVGALTLGLAAARGRYLARMDADDESLPTRLEQSVAALEAQPSLSGLGTGVEIFRDDRPASPALQAYGRWLSSLTSPEKLRREALIESPLCHPSVTLRTGALRAVGGWRDGDFPEDWELWLRLLESGHALTCLPQVLHRWRDADVRLTRTDARYGRPQHLRLRARTLAKRFEGTPLTVWGTGPGGLKLTRALWALGAQVVRFVDVHPRKVGTRIENVPVLAPEDLGPPPATGHLLAAVGAHGARAEIRAALDSTGWLEGRDYTCVA